MTKRVDIKVVTFILGHANQTVVTQSLTQSTETNMDTECVWLYSDMKESK